MKNQFSKTWNASKQPRKQRKYLAKAPLHIRKNFVTVNLSKELREKQGKRNEQVKKGDTVRIMRGKYKGKRGKVLSVNLKDSRLTVEGIQVKKQDGSNVNVKMRPSNLQITELGERVKKSAEGQKKSTTKKTTKKASENKTSKKASSNKEQETKSQGDKE